MSFRGSIASGLAAATLAAGAAPAESHEQLAVKAETGFGNPNLILQSVGDTAVKGSSELTTGTVSEEEKEAQIEAAKSGLERGASIGLIKRNDRSYDLLDVSAPGNDDSTGYGVRTISFRAYLDKSDGEGPRIDSDRKFVEGNDSAFYKKFRLPARKVTCVEGKKDAIYVLQETVEWKDTKEDSVDTSAKRVYSFPLNYKKSPYKKGKGRDGC